MEESRKAYATGESGSLRRFVRLLRSLRDRYETPSADTPTRGLDWARVCRDAATQTLSVRGESAHLDRRRSGRRTGSGVVEGRVGEDQIEFLPESDSELRSVAVESHNRTSLTMSALPNPFE